MCLCSKPNKIVNFSISHVQLNHCMNFLKNITSFKKINFVITPLRESSSSQRI
jgi:hypothetical protein